MESNEHVSGESTEQATEESTGNAALDKRLSSGVLKGDTGTEAAQVWIGAFLIAALGFIVYLGSFSIPLHGLDLTLLRDSDALQRVVTSLDALETLPGAPLSVIGLAAGRALTGGGVDVLHGLSILLHLGCAVLVFLVVRRLLPSGTPEAIAMLAGMFFVAHPLAGGTVNYLAGYPLIQAAFFGLLALVFLLRGAAQGNFCAASLGASIACFVLAFGSHTSALVLPVLGIAMIQLRAPGSVQPIFRRAATPSLVVTVVALWVVGQAAGILSAGRAGDFWSGSGNLLLSSVYPLRQYLLPLSPGMAVGVIGLVLFVGLAVTGIWFRQYVLAQAGTWAILGLIGASFYGGGDLGGTMFCLYFPFAGLALLLPWGIAAVQAPGARRIAGGGAAAAVLLLGGLSFRQTETWKSPALLWEAEMARHPESIEPLVELARFQTAVAEVAPSDDQQAKEEFFNAALTAWKVVLERSPGLPLAERNAGILAAGLGKMEEGLPLLESATARSPEDPELALYLAYAREQVARTSPESGNALAAYRAFRRAARLGPLPLEAQGRYGMLAASFGELETGVALLTAAAGDDEESPLRAPLQQFTTAAQQIRALNERADAALAQDPAGVEGMMARVERLLAEGRAMQAFYVLQAVLARAPQNDAAWSLAGMVSARLDGAQNFLNEWGASRAGNTAAWELLAARCGASGAWDGAEAYLRHGLTGVAGAMPELKLAEIAMQFQQAEQATAYLDAAQKAWPDSPLPWLRAADLSIALQDNLRARTQLDEAEKRGASPEDVKARRDKLGTTGQTSSPSGIERTVIR